MATAATSLPQILIRADGNDRIGSGHIRRCLSVAMRLREWGASCTFVCRSSAASFNYLVSEAGFDLVELPSGHSTQEDDADQTVAAIRGSASFNAVLVDHYELDQVWESALRSVAGRIVVIDDLADRLHDCDILVDVAPQERDRYDGLVAPDCQLLLGPAYAMLRREFRLARITPSGHVSRVLVSFGGVDPDNLTATAILGINKIVPQAAIDAVVTALSPHIGALRDMAAHDSLLTLHVDANAGGMAALMQSADIAVGAGGSTSWERACMGLPSIVAVIAENQRTTAAALERMGCALSVDAGPAFAEELGAALRTLAGSAALRRLMAAAAMQAVDGRGTDRVARAILPPVITLRPAVSGDAEAVWQWRNAPDVRSTAIDTAEIGWDDHSRWFANRLIDPETILLVAQDRGHDVGVIRFDLCGDEAKVSIFMAPGLAGRGLGPTILRAGQLWVCDARPEIARFAADVRPENAASIALFEGAGYRPQRISFERTTND